MTLNSLTAACNQKTSRFPVVEYDEETVVLALNSLKGQSLVATAVGGGSRVVKYKHNFTTVFEMSDAQLCLLCLLMLRGPQTPGELNSNSGRLYEFASLESVYEALNGLLEKSPPFVKELPRKPGQKETRFVHLLGEEMWTEDPAAPDEPARKNVSSLEARLSAVEQELATVKESLAKLLGELGQ
jgi:uncharacterized protein YceH (UPF0502 family)